MHSVLKFLFQLLIRFEIDGVVPGLGIGPPHSMYIVPVSYYGVKARRLSHVAKGD